MRLVPSSSFCWRLAGAIGCVAVGALCCTDVPLTTPALGETTNASLWACATTAALALVSLKQSR